MIPNSKRTHAAAWWIGLWRTPNAWISLKASGDHIQVTGHANWRGERFGEFTAAAALKGDEVDVVGAPGACSMRLIAFGQRIVAADNGQCGAPNVGFSGFYVRKK
jgi:hypothetical protein